MSGEAVSRPACAAPGGPGTRSVDRTLQVLLGLSSRGEFGWRLTDLADHVGLDPGTCHRILACLVSGGFARRYPRDVKYYPGQRLFEMGVGLPQYAAFRDRVEPRLEQLALATRCICSFSLRSGHEVVCVFQKKGGVELAAMMVRVGTRRPLIGAAGGLAILKMLPGQEARRIIEANLALEANGGPRRYKAFQQMQERSAGQPYAFSAGDIAPGVHAMALGVEGVDGEALGAITVTGSPERISAASVPALHARVTALAEEIRVDALQCFQKQRS